MILWNAEMALVLSVDARHYQPCTTNPPYITESKVWWPLHLVSDYTTRKSFIFLTRNEQAAGRAAGSLVVRAGLTHQTETDIL